MEFEESSSNNIFGTDCGIVVILFDLIVPGNDLLKGHFGRFFSLQSSKDWIQMILFELSK